VKPLAEELRAGEDYDGAIVRSLVERLDAGIAWIAIAVIAVAHARRR
jgi:hypothetical protein